MNNDLISRSALLEAWREIRGVCVPDLVVDYMIGEAPAVDAVSPGVLEQYKWERDTAIAQLKELGIGFGEKKPDMVEAVRCRGCVNREISPINPQRMYCHGLDVSLPTNLDFYCARGVKMDAEVEG